MVENFASWAGVSSRFDGSRANIRSIAGGQDKRRGGNPEPHESESSRRWTRPDSQGDVRSPASMRHMWPHGRRDPSAEDGRRIQICARNFRARRKSFCLIPETRSERTSLVMSTAVYMIAGIQ